MATGRADTPVEPPLLDQRLKQVVMLADGLGTAQEQITLIVKGEVESIR